MMRRARGVQPQVAHIHRVTQSSGYNLPNAETPIADLGEHFLYVLKAARFAGRSARPRTRRLAASLSAPNRAGGNPSGREHAKGPGADNSPGAPNSNRLNHGHDLHAHPGRRPGPARASGPWTRITSTTARGDPAQRGQLAPDAGNDDEDQGDERTHPPPGREIVPDHAQVVKVVRPGRVGRAAR